MRQKLKDCQKFRMKAYQHLGQYIDGHLVWFQHLNGNAWLGPAAVLCHRGQSVWIHTHGDVKKMAACHVKPYQLINREAVKNKSEQDAEWRQVMLEDGLEDMDTLQDSLKDEEKDTMGANHLKAVNIVSISDLSVYTVELPVLEH